MSNPQQTALVTGASSGMGKAIARQLVGAGYRVYVAARRTEEMQDLAAAGARVLALDLSRPADIEAVARQVLGEAGVVDVLVNNAGFGLFGAVEETTLDEARYQFEVNLFGTARLTQLLLPAMRQQGAGTIVNITSMGGRIYTPLGAWYHATKHALEGWSDCLRLEVAEFGIRVVVVEPGVIETGFGDVVTQRLGRQQGGAYGRLTRAVIDSTRRSYAPGQGSDPGVIGRVVLAAVQARRPRTRYVAGKLARPLLFVRKWFGDRVFDRLLLSQVN